MRRSVARRSRSSSSSSLKAEQVTRKIHTLGGALLRDFIVLAQERRQPQRFQVMVE
jgi:hypothetical protein